MSKNFNYFNQLNAALLAGVEQLLGAAMVEPAEDLPTLVARTLTPTRNPRHGDFTSTVALQLAGQLRQAPQAVAAALLTQIPDLDFVSKITPVRGYLNFTFTPEIKTEIVKTILTAPMLPWGTGAISTYGEAGSVKSAILLEFVSANPTGPLHVGHGRAAVVGDVLGNILTFAGYPVHREYYVNDAGRQVQILATSVWFRYFSDESAPTLPEGLYQGDYLADLAQAPKIKSQLAQLTPPTRSSGNLSGEAGIDYFIEQFRTQFASPAAADDFVGTVAAAGLALIKTDLTRLGVAPYDCWFSEQSLHATGQLAHVISMLKKELPKNIFTAEGALWFRSTAYGDDKDRVLRRADGRWTYFAADLAYHADKLSRFPPVGMTWTFLNILGADHHGYTPRLAAAVAALAKATLKSPPTLKSLLIQFVGLVKDGVRIKNSTRAGNFLPLAQLMDEIGVDAARYFYLMRKNDQNFDIDLALAKEQSPNNPVYYLQYAHARAAGVLRAWEKEFNGVDWNPGAVDQPLPAVIAQANLSGLQSNPAALVLCQTLAEYPNLVQNVAETASVHLFVNYLNSLATAFHRYYDQTRILTNPDDPELPGRLALLGAAKIVLNAGLKLLGISAPAVMNKNPNN